MFLHGPSLLLPKALFGVQLPLLERDDEDVQQRSEAGESERQRVQRWDTIERAVLRGLVMLRSSAHSKGGDGIGEFQHNLFLANGTKRDASRAS